jgi:hypothetical protein
LMAADGSAIFAATEKENMTGGTFATTVAISAMPGLSAAKISAIFAGTETGIITGMTFAPNVVTCATIFGGATTETPSATVGVFAATDMTSDAIATLCALIAATVVATVKVKTDTPIGVTSGMTAETDMPREATSSMTTKINVPTGMARRATTNGAGRLLLT